MITTISLQNYATFGTASQRMTSLAPVNFVYGANAVGKTTISRVIAGAVSQPGCQLSWRASPIQALVYNRDFVAANFDEVSQIQGVFTLGEENVENQRKIEVAQGELAKLQKEAEGVTRTLQGDDGQGGKNGELASLEDEFVGDCWSAFKEYPKEVAGGFSPFRNDRKKFCAEVLRQKGVNAADLKTLEALVADSETLFGSAPTTEMKVSVLNGTRLVDLGSEAILGKSVVGKNDVDIAALIEKLRNSDWVKEGQAYLEETDGDCPFCQQELPSGFEASLNDYFDESFRANTAEIQRVADEYRRASETVLKPLDTAAASPSRFLNKDKMADATTALRSLIALNQERIVKKQHEPSRSISLEPLAESLQAVSDVIAEANTAIDAHNAMVNNLSQEQTKHKNSLWKHILEEHLKSTIASYDAKRTGIQAAITGLQGRIATKKSEIEAKTAEIKALEQQTTSVQPTIDAINSLLHSFGFQGFSLAAASSGHSYQLLRPDGSEAKETLSEGERTFVTFLYFYHLLSGSISDTGIVNDRIVVFDDPISSLDSDVLFVVSNLIRKVISHVRAGTGSLKQVFLLTHNVYFHKEVTFRTDREPGRETFWTVRKCDNISTVHLHQSNPIKTSYDLLWEELRNPNGTSLTIQNSMRRILEHYFKILGGIDQDEICDKFEGVDRIVCGSLFSWINDGSHSALDDLCLSLDEHTVEKYRDVFRRIFEEMGHLQHYYMMMRTDSPEDTEVRLRLKVNLKQVSQVAYQRKDMGFTNTVSEFCYGFGGVPPVDVIHSGGGRCFETGMT